MINLIENNKRRLTDKPSLDEPYEPQGIWRTHLPAWRVVVRLLATQAAIGAVVSLAWLLSSLQAAAAGITGTLIAIVPTLFFAAKVFAQKPGTPPRQVVRAFHIGEAIRLILTATLFIIALQWFSGEFVPLITTFAASLFSYWLILLGALRT